MGVRLYAGQYSKGAAEIAPVAFSPAMRPENDPVPLLDQTSQKFLAIESLIRGLISHDIYLDSPMTPLV